MPKQRPLSKSKDDLIDEIIIKLGLLRCKLNEVKGDTLVPNLHNTDLSKLKLINMNLNPILVLTDEEN